MLTETFIDNYKSRLNHGLTHIEPDIFREAVELITDCHKRHGKVFVAGNGGSAAIAEHFSCDHSKGVASNTRYFPRVMSLTSNVSLLTAYANDMGYEQVFSQQLILHGNMDDVLVVVSSSGSSPNIIEAIRVAKALKMHVIALTGFTGGQARHDADIALHIPIFNYGIVEDCHQIIMHMLAQYIRTVDTNVDMKSVKL